MINIQISHVLHQRPTNYHLSKIIQILFSLISVYRPVIDFGADNINLNYILSIMHIRLKKLFLNFNPKFVSN